MSHPASNCPQCGARVEFRWSAAVQAVCEYCRSILVRTDLDLRKVGVVADWAMDNASPIQINTEGVFDKKAFVVVGRIMYEYELGGWNEWHLLFNDDTSGWLSDAQLEWAVSQQFGPNQQVPALGWLQPGRPVRFGERNYQVTTVTTAHYKGVEGQLPFTYWDKSDVTFVDLGSTSSDFATIDFSEPQPMLFTGRFVDFDELRLSNLREFEGWS